MWYDRQKLTQKEVHRCQYAACMNPTSGSFTINSRLQRHFCVFGISLPGPQALQTIYQSIYHGHVKHGNFSVGIQRIVEKIVQAALSLHIKVSSTFLPTAIKFHYLFNLRDMSNLFQGILFSTAEMFKTPLDIVRLWLHESSRVYCDKLVEMKDIEMFNKIKFEIAKQSFEDLDEESLSLDPLIFCHFATGIGEPKYAMVSNWDNLRRILDEALEIYNEVNAVMNLVLFEDAMQHVCRINRILETPRGNALLVGVGGSGKQSLARLAASVSVLDVFQITLRKGYSMADMRVDLAQLYIKAGVKNVGTVFLLTDAQVPEEKFLVLVNDLLASGEIPDLFAEDDLEIIYSGVKNEVRGLGMEDSRENCWRFFIERVRRQLKVVLCFSPVGNTLRVRARKFPALVNCTSINWFHEWPEVAMVSVSERFISENEFVPEETREPISRFMAYVHRCVNDMSLVYLTNERRYNYTTPKTFLELISLYLSMLSSKNKELTDSIERLENGLTKLINTASQVDDLKEKLKAQEIELKQKNDDADALIQRVGVETEIVQKEKAIADVEEKKVAIKAEEVTIKQRSCEEDLSKAEPALIAAGQALDTLNKNNLSELKAFSQPPPAVLTVTSACMVLLSPSSKIPKDRSWKSCKIMMGKVDQFLDSLIHYDKENIGENNLKEVQRYLDDPEFTYENILTKSSAAAGLCSWAVNIVGYYRIFCDVEPKRLALKSANDELASAQDKLSKIQAKLKSLNDNLAELTREFEEATAAKLKCQQEAEETTQTISLANRLVGGLGSEKVRWGDTIQQYKQELKKLPGDVLLASAYLSYMGCFGRIYRVDLLNNYWLPFFKDIKVTACFISPHCMYVHYLSLLLACSVLY